MVRILTIFGAVLVIAVSAGLYHVKYAVERMQRENLALEAQIREEQAAIRILEAEWSRLNRPDRLQNLSGRLLQLSPIDAGQIVGFRQLPPRLPDPGKFDGNRDLVSSGPRPNPLRGLGPIRVADTTNVVGQE